MKQCDVSHCRYLGFIINPLFLTIAKRFTKNNFNNIYFQIKSIITISLNITWITRTSETFVETLNNINGEEIIWKS